MNEVEGTITELEETMPPEASGTEDADSTSPLSEKMKTVGRQLQWCRTKKEEIATKRRRALIRLGRLEAQEASDSMEAIAAGTDPMAALTEDARQRQEAIREAREEVLACEALTANLPKLEADLARRFMAGKNRERAEAHQRLEKDFLKIVRSEIAPQLRQALKITDAALPRIRRLYAEAAVWAGTADIAAPGDWSGTSFPLPSVQGSALGFVRWVLATLPHEVQK